jgi:hypothetical protein
VFETCSSRNIWDNSIKEEGKQHVISLSPDKTIITKGSNILVSTPALYLEVPQFESQPEDQLPRPGFRVFIMLGAWMYGFFIHSPS